MDDGDMVIQHKSGERTMLPVGGIDVGLSDDIIRRAL